VSSDAGVDRQSAHDADQTALDTDQTLSDVDQSTSDADRAAGVADRATSERDEALASADQRASDHDRLAAERDMAEGTPVTPERRHAHEVSVAERETSTAERAATAVLRAQTAAERLDEADHRDEASRLRDLAAQARDRAAEARDHVAAQMDPVGPAAEARAQAAADRARAAADRQRAAADREQAAVERHQVRTALSEAHLDELTGTFRRGLGTLALQREINRARHSHGRLVLAFVDVDNLKAINDREGHAAGDALLIDVAATIRSKLRSYDPIVRFGGDEFVCAFSDFDLDGVRARFEDIRVTLDARRKGRSISVGLAELRDGDTLDDLTERGDAALYDAKRRKHGNRSNGPALRRPSLRYLTRRGA
jgi:diguanylate cyclase (GGDEF)-like protein